MPMASRYVSRDYRLTDNMRPLTTCIKGEREADYESDFWADHDENCHGRINELEDEYPQGFVWTCCDEIGTADGCETGRHRQR